MTEAQRYLFDMMGYLHLEQALKRTELKAAQQAINRYVNASDDELPEGFGRSTSLFDKIAHNSNTLLLLTKYWKHWSSIARSGPLCWKYLGDARG